MKIWKARYPHAKPSPIFNELQNTDYQNVTKLHKKHNIKSCWKSLQSASNHRTICIETNHKMNETARQSEWDCKGRGLKWGNPSTEITSKQHRNCLFISSWSSLKMLKTDKELYKRATTSQGNCAETCISVKRSKWNTYLFISLYSFRFYNIIKKCIKLYFHLRISIQSDELPVKMLLFQK